MKKTEYGKLWELHTEQNWMDHFRNNMNTGKGPVSITSCVDCDEIIDYPTEHVCAKIQKRINKQLGIPELFSLCPTCRGGYIQRHGVYLYLHCTNCCDTWDDQRSRYYKGPKQ